MIRRQLGLQLYTLRDEAEKDFENMLRQASQVGFTSVEFAGFGGIPAKEMEKLLNRYGLTPCGAHIGLEELEQHLAETAAYNKSIHNKVIVIPYAEMHTRADIDALVKRINAVLPKVRQLGLTLCYHNHVQEFEIIDGIRAIDELLTKTEVQLELDTFWAFTAGEDVAEFMRKNRMRITQIHLKDGTGGYPAAIGRGTAPCKRVYQLAKELNILNIIENDNPIPDGLTDISYSYNHICVNF
ncbi:sugar phosphate isomerase/epimerase family protein [Acetanaerobacterium elongatum]|uniref:Sugar phosphate isomerase/epimerase n=1 Tax=Acetanaerobacterium elongatum TaxID=258515 RepID=A0A1H0E0E7_9FIRM|nr:sugar phosphate isomerase/epimerase [Acetanaerobacterium elongatum]SDN75839.1 Sugar phosphate isomerase/epimerase [Acetanaerobacterium elongatum]